MSFSLVIPTYNRQDDLGRCLNSIAVQTELPAEIVLVDDGQLDDGFVAGWRERLTARGVALTYRRKDHAHEPRGTSASRNLALEIVSQPVFFILDDDTVLEPDFCRRVMGVWRDRAADRDLLGVGGVISNARRRSAWERVFHRLFGLTSPLAWDITPTGFQVWDDGLAGRAVGHYAHGGVCSYDLAKARALGGWTVFSGGRAALEDVDFCARAKLRGWHFIIEPAARLAHYPSPASREGDYQVGLKESRNRREIFRVLNPRPGLLDRIRFLRASKGWILRQCLAGHWAKAAGLIAGLL